jgi:hypothetical protein
MEGAGRPALTNLDKELHMKVVRNVVLVALVAAAPLALAHRDGGPGAFQGGYQGGAQGDCPGAQAGAQGMQGRYADRQARRDAMHQGMGPGAYQGARPEFRPRFDRAPQPEVSE